VDKERTERGYVAAISKVLLYVQEHLDDELTPIRLAREACFSQHHFHRVFRAVVGESVMDHVRRLRLERAAFEIRKGRRSIADVAFDAGYQAQEAFTRVFAAYYGMAPSLFRASQVSYLVPAACGVHYGSRGFTALHKPVDPACLEPTDLCPAHRDYPERFEQLWEEMLSILTGFAGTIFPLGKEKFSMSNAPAIDQEIADLHEQVQAAKQRLNEAIRRRPPEEVQDYVLQDSDGNDVRLSELFGGKEDLILVHNMGTGCSYCTMWADGFTGLVPHLSDRAAFVVCSPDKPEVQKRFAEKRHWNFKMVSSHDSPFTKDMGFWKEDGPDSGPWPGVSTFKRDADGKIYRVAKTHFGPGDDFCAVWPLLDLLDEGVKGWEPKYFY
jgi:AraC-like DNA-binding protein/predicted dithiol-disulfide oxidoreductase (DUF899 family)